MDYQNYQVVQPIPQNQQITYEPYYPPPNIQSYAPQPYPQSNQPNQFYPNPQYQNPNNNIIYQPQIAPSNHYNVVPQEPLMIPFEGNKIEIPFERKGQFYCFWTTMIISTILAIIPSIISIFTPIVLIIENLLFLYFENNKIVIIKDESENKVYIKLINCLCIKRKKLVFDLDKVNFNVIFSNQQYILLIVNNCKSGEIDLNTSDVRNIPLHILYYFIKIDIKKFNGQYQINNILNSFSRSQENPLKFDINEYMLKQQLNLNQSNQYNLSKYIKINEHFFTYYSKDPLIKNNYILRLFKSNSIFLHSMLCFGALIALLMSLDDFDDDDEIDIVSIMLLVFGFLYCISISISFCIFQCVNCNKKNLRIDIIYSFDFDKIFIGVNDEKKYLSKSEFNINELERFILQKNKNEESGFHLNAILKGNINREIYYIKDQKPELQGLVFILNEKIANNINTGNNNNVNNNNVNDNNVNGNNVNDNNVNDNNSYNVEQQRLSECPPPLATTVY